MKRQKTKTEVAWAIFLQIISRSEEMLVPVMTHPCGEQYECLTVVKTNDHDGMSPVVDINLHGTGINVKPNSILQYDEMMSDSEIEILVERIMELMGLRYSAQLRSLPGMEFIRELLALDEQCKMGISNAWYDGSYHSGLSEEAKTFPFYSVRNISNPPEHYPWWTISSKDLTIAMINLETNELTTLVGKRYDLKTEKEGALKAMSVINNNTGFSVKSKLDIVIADALQHLSSQPEWVDRYAGYANIISSNITSIKAKRATFHEWEPLRLYLNVTNAKKTSPMFQLRYLGQAVADLTSKNGIMIIDSKLYDKINDRDFDCKVCLKKVDWTGKDAQYFRNHFKSRQPIRNVVTGKGKIIKNKGNEEHRIESLLLSEFSKTKNKVFRNIRPVTIANIRFPMPTPLSASNHNIIKYSGINGGGIDILARVGTGGRATNLCIMEVKDENTKKELPIEAMKQAVTYATFIRELLRSKSGQTWWKLFGFSGKVPDQGKLVLYAACVMPSNQNNDTSFKGMKLNVNGDTIELHYLYFDEFITKTILPSKYTSI